MAGLVKHNLTAPEAVGIAMIAGRVSSTARKTSKRRDILHTSLTGYHGKPYSCCRFCQNGLLDHRGSHFLVPGPRCNRLRGVHPGN
jgi:hypothetical protein